MKSQKNNLVISAFVFVALISAGLILKTTYNINLEDSLGDQTIFTSAQISNPDGTITVKTDAIALTEAEIVSPMRGLYKWRGVETAPLPEASDDAYQRYEWKTFETSQDTYNFTTLDNDIQAAYSSGKKFSFRVRSMIGYNDTNLYVPTYMQSYGWRADTDNNGTADTFIPDWNNPYFIERAGKLISELGRRYNSDKRVAYIDIGMFGQYGEWVIDTTLVDYSKAPNGIVPITEESKKKYIDMYTSAFPDKQLVTFLIYKNYDAIKYAFASPIKYPIGWRIDCLGRLDFFNQWTNHLVEWSTIQERWKVAPAVTEYCSSGISFSDALSQIKSYHISMVGNGNIGNWSSYSSDQQAKFIEVGKTAGYRIELTNINYPATIEVNKSFEIKSDWRNVGVAPIYENWDVYYQFRDISTDSIIWESKSSANLKSLLPSTTYTSFSDSFTLSTTLPISKYKLSVVIKDPITGRGNLPLAIRGKQSDGSYYISDIQVGTVSQTPAQEPVQTPTEVADTALPVISLTYPLTDMSASKNTNFTFTANASDDIGVTKVEFYVNDVLTCSDSTASYSCSWKMPGAKNGRYRIYAKAYDNAGNAATSSSITISLK